MKKWILICTILPHLLFSQNLNRISDKWLDMSLSEKNVDRNELLEKFVKYDYSSLWLTKQDETIGYIGNNYQRFYIRFINIEKDLINPVYYFVKGKSRVGNKICDFNGKIKILHIREMDKVKRENLLDLIKENKDSDIMRRFKNVRFVVFAEYTLKENKDQKWSGSFQGVLKSFFYIENEKVFYDDSNFEYSDSFSNNLFVGNWMSYTTGFDKICCWGNFRIPYSFDLDVGVSEFSPNDKYLKNGWESYHKAYFENNKNALNEEQKKWW